MLVLPSTCFDFRPHFPKSLSTCRPARLTHTHAQVHARPLVPPTWSMSHSPSLCGRWGGGKFSRLYGPPCCSRSGHLGSWLTSGEGGFLRGLMAPAEREAAPERPLPSLGAVWTLPLVGPCWLAGWFPPPPVPTGTELTRQPRLCAWGRVDGRADGRVDVSFVCGGSGSPRGSQVLSGTPGSCETATEQDT